MASFKTTLRGHKKYYEWPLGTFLSRGQKRFIVDSMIFENNGKSGEEVAKNLSIF